jgi:hypothetical protein
MGFAGRELKICAGHAQQVFGQWRGVKPILRRAKNVRPKVSKIFVEMPRNGA